MELLGVTREEWRCGTDNGTCSTMEHGAQFVMTSGTLTRPELLAG